MGGGSQGTTTTTTDNTPWNANELRRIQTDAIRMMDTNPLGYYPGQTFVNPTQSQYDAITGTANLGRNANDAIAPLIPGMQRDAIEQNQRIARGGAIETANPWFAQLTDIASKNPSAVQQGLLNNVGQGAYMQAAQPYLSGLFNLGGSNAAQPGMNMLAPVAQGGYFAGSQPMINQLAQSGYTGPGAGQLSSTAEGAYLGRNPFLDATFQAASRPVTDAFMTATAPQTDASFAKYGRFGSGANNLAREMNQEALGRSLAGLSAGIYAPAYEAERGRQVGAARDLGNLQQQGLSNAITGYNTGVNTIANAAANYGQLGVQGNQAQQNAINAAANQYQNQVGNIISAATGGGQLANQGAGIQVNAADANLRNYYNMVNQQQAAINNAPQLTNMGFGNLQQLYNAGTQDRTFSQENLQDLANRYYGNQYGPWQTLSQAASIVGNPIQGITNTTSPYFQNKTAQGVGMAMTGLQTAAMLGGK